MIGVLLRKDPAVRMLPWMALGGAGIGALGVVMVDNVVDTGDEVWRELGSTLVVAPLLQCLVVAWFTASGGWGAVRERAAELQLVLPVPLRTWIALRAVALLLIGWLPLLLVAGALFVAVDAPWYAKLLANAGACALAWAAWVALCFAWRPARPRLDSWPAFVAISAVGFGLAWTAVVAPGIGAALALAVALGAGASAWRGIPAVMEVRGAVTARRSKEHVAEAPARAAASGQRIWIARRTCLLGRNVALLGAAALMLSSSAEDDGPVSVTLLVALFFAGAIADHSLRVLRDVGHLPIPRARLAPWVLLPPLGALLAGFAGIALRQHLDPGVDRAEEVDLRSRGEDSERVSVPGALLVPVLGREPLVITAPWGESAALRPEPLVPGSPLAFANPYDIAPDSSLDFVAWQLSRAVRAAHGVEVAPEELRERYLSMLDGRVIGPFFGQRLRKDHPELERVARPGRVGWNAATVVLGWLVACAFVTRRNVPPADRTAWRRARRRVYARSVAAGVLLVLLLVLPFALTGRLDGVQDALAGALVRAVGGNEWIVPAAAVALAVAGYRWLARRFARLEVPPALKRTWYESSG